MITTQTSRFLDHVLDVLAAFVSATVVTAAVRVGHTPGARDLVAVGIRPEDFAKIRRL